MIDDPPDKRNWWTAEHLDDLLDDAVEALVVIPSSCRLSYSQMLLLPWGGEVAAHGLAAGSSGAPRTSSTRSASGTGAERDEEHIAWGRAGRDALARWKSGGVYLNFVGDEGEERIRRLRRRVRAPAAVEERLDPGNLFHGNQNIRPRGQLVS